MISAHSPHEKTDLVVEILSALPATELRIVRDTAEEKRKEKLEETKQLVIEEMRARLAEAGIEPDQINVSFGRRRVSARAKYRSPEGKTWTGQGFAPRWLADLEEQGHSRDELLISEDTGSGTSLPVR